jgi:hypothetical protein
MAVKSIGTSDQFEQNQRYMYIFAMILEQRFGQISTNISRQISTKISRRLSTPG